MSNLEEASSVLKKINDNHKQYNKNIEGNQLLYKSAEDYALFRTLHYAFNCIENIILYFITKNADNDTLVYIKTKKPCFPEDEEQLLTLYGAFPVAIDKIHDDLYEIITLPSFRLMMVYKKIPVGLLYSITGDDSTKIIAAKEDIEFLLVKSNHLINLINQAENKEL